MTTETYKNTMEKETTYTLRTIAFSLIQFLARLVLFISIFCWKIVRGLTRNIAIGFEIFAEQAEKHGRHHNQQ